MSLFPEDSAARKEYPIYSGFLQYFPAAIAAIARHSYLGNQKHNPGQPLNHDRSKSGDEPDALARHLMEGDYVGMAWRALSMLQKHLEANGAPIAPAARNATLTAAQALTMVECGPPELDPATAALVERLDASENPTEGLRAGQADDPARSYEDGRE